MAQSAVRLIRIAEHRETFDGILRGSRLITLLIFVPRRLFRLYGSHKRSDRHRNVGSGRRSVEDFLEIVLVGIDSVQRHGNSVGIATHLATPCSGNLSFERGRASIPIPLFVV